MFVINSSEYTNSNYKFKTNNLIFYNKRVDHARQC